MVKKDTFGNATMTPFLPKATFTSVSTPMNLTPGAELIIPSLPASLEPTLIETTNEVENVDQASSTPSSTPTSGENPLRVSATLTPMTPFVTSTMQAVPYTSIPSSATTVPAATSVPIATSVPTATSVFTATSVPTMTLAPAPTSIPDECSFSGNATYENQVVTLINQERNNRGLSTLTQNSSLQLAARRHSEDMACNDFFSHTGSDGSTLSSRILAAGYSYSWAAENIAASSNCSFSAQSVVSMWMNSTGHRNNMLSENAVHIGVGFRCASDSTSGDLDAYYTADFGRP